LLLGLLSPLCAWLVPSSSDISEDDWRWRVMLRELLDWSEYIIRMEAQQSFEYEGYLINLCSSEGGSKVRLEAIAPDREAQYLGEQKLERFNYKTFVAALSKANSKLNVEITYPEETKMVVSLLFSDPLIGKMSECVTLTKQGNVVLHDRLKYLSSKLGVQLSAYKKISSTFASGTFFSSYVPQCGIDPSRLQQINYE
jgi:hypothetical protein